MGRSEDIQELGDYLTSQMSESIAKPLSEPQKYDPSKVKMTIGGKECVPVTVEMEEVTVYAVKCVVRGMDCYVVGLGEDRPDETEVIFTRYSEDAWYTESEACAELTAKALAGHSPEVVKGTVRRPHPDSFFGIGLRGKNDTA
jgi:hypothetical protein